MNDLDKLEPKPQEVTMQGKTITVYPAKVRSMMAIEAYWKDLRDPESEIAKDNNKLLNRIFEILTPLIPAMKDDTSIDFTAEQLVWLMNFVYNMGNKPKEEEKTDEKKSELPTPT